MGIFKKVTLVSVEGVQDRRYGASFIVGGVYSFYHDDGGYYPWLCVEATEDGKVKFVPPPQE